MNNVVVKFRLLIIFFASITFTHTTFSQVNSPNKALLSASNNTTPELSFINKKKANSADKKAPRMVLSLHKPTLEVFNHVLRILVSSDKGIFHLKGKVSDKVSGVAAVFVGGKKIDVDAYGSFQTNIRLTKQYNVVKVIAIDHSGNQEVKELAIKTTTPVAATVTKITNANQPSAAERWVK